MFQARSHHHYQLIIHVEDMEIKKQHWSCFSLSRMKSLAGAAGVLTPPNPTELDRTAVMLTLTYTLI